MKNQYEIDYQQGYDVANDEWLDRINKIRAEITDCLKALDDIEKSRFNDSRWKYCPKCGRRIKIWQNR